MKLLLVTDCFIPSQLSVAILMRDLAGELSRRGHEVTVLVADGSVNGNVVREVDKNDGYDVVRIRAGKTKNVGLVRRAINEMTMSFRVWRAGKAWFDAQQFDGIVFYSPSIFWGPLVRKLKQRYGCRAYLVLRDIFPKWALDVGLLKKGPHYYIFRWFEKLQYDVSDVIGVQSPANLQYFHDEMPGVKATKEVLYNWTAPKTAIRVATNYRDQFDLHGNYLFVYGGNLGKAQGVNSLIALAKGLRNEPAARLIIAGGGTEAKWLKEAVERETLSNVLLLGGLPEAEYEGLLCECDCGVITLNPAITSHNIPGKLLSYLSAELPVIALVNGGNDLKQLIEDSDAGIVVDSGDIERFIGAAREVMHSGGREGYRARARKLLVEYFSSEAAGMKVETQLRETRSEKTSHMTPC